MMQGGKLGCSSFDSSKNQTKPRAVDTAVLQYLLSSLCWPTFAWCPSPSTQNARFPYKNQSRFPYQLQVYLAFQVLRGKDFRLGNSKD